MTLPIVSGHEIQSTQRMTARRKLRKNASALGNETVAKSVAQWNILFKPSKIPSLLYHYTTFDGLIGILETHSLRATFSETLNDGSEWKYGRKIVKSKSGPISSTVRNELTPPPGFVQPPPTRMFVTCFCEKPNLLSMWRSYTAQGGGFSLGFDGARLADLQRANLVPGSFAPRLVKVYYGTTLPKAMLRLLQAGGHVHAEWVLENMIKHKAFEEEREWRIIVADPPVSMMTFHRGNATIKVSIPVRTADRRRIPDPTLPSLQPLPLPLKKLVYGPTLRDDTALRKTLKWLLERYGYKDVAVEASRIPYRL
jgi:hypothetical protein